MEPEEEAETSRSGLTWYVPVNVFAISAAQLRDVHFADTHLLDAEVSWLACNVMRCMF